MSSIGPQIPAHLLAQIQSSNNDSDDNSDSDTGPQPSTATVVPSRPLAPSIPLVHPSRYDSDSDDDIGPKPLAAGQYEQPDPVKEFMEKEEKRKKAVQVGVLNTHFFTSNSQVFSFKGSFETSSAET
jgi:hypothetical protein